jgi:hypothetical protein
MKKIVVFHDNEGLAKRARRGRPGETIAYRSKKEYDDIDLSEYDEVLDFSTKKKSSKKR